MSALVDRLGTARRGRLSGLRQWLAPPDRDWLDVRLWMDLQPAPLEHPTAPTDAEERYGEGASTEGNAPQARRDASDDPALSGVADVLRARILAAVEATHLAVLQAIRQTRPARFSESVLLELACERMERLAIHQDAVWRRTHAEFDITR